VRAACSGAAAASSLFDIGLAVDRDGPRRPAGSSSPSEVEQRASLRSPTADDRVDLAASASNDTP